MAGSKQNCRAKDLQKYLEENIPNAILVSRSTTNRGAEILDKKSGKPLYVGKSNFDVLDQLTDPLKKEKKKSIQPLLDIPPEIRIKDQAENAAIYAISWLNKLAALMGKDWSIKKDKNGLVTKIVCKNMEFNLNGRKIK